MLNVENHKSDRVHNFILYQLLWLHFITVPESYLITGTVPVSVPLRSIIKLRYLFLYGKRQKGSGSAKLYLIRLVTCPSICFDDIAFLVEVGPLSAVGDAFCRSMGNRSTYYTAAIRNIFYKAVFLILRIRYLSVLVDQIQINYYLYESLFKSMFYTVLQVPVLKSRLTNLNLF